MPKLPNQLTLVQHRAVAQSLNTIEAELEKLRQAINSSYGMASTYHKQWVSAKREIYQVRGMLEAALVQEHRLDPWTARKLYAQSQEEVEEQEKQKL